MLMLLPLAVADQLIDAVVSTWVLELRAEAVQRHCSGGLGLSARHAVEEAAVILQFD